MSNEEEKLLCITPDCGKPAKWKGICGSCYGVANQLITEGKTTWDELAALGLAIIPDKPFMKAFKQKKVQQPIF